MTCVLVVKVVFPVSAAPPGVVHHPPVETHPIVKQPVVLPAVRSGEQMVMPPLEHLTGSLVAPAVLPAGTVPVAPAVAPVVPGTVPVAAPAVVQADIAPAVVPVVPGTVPLAPAVAPVLPGTVPVAPAASPVVAPGETQVLADGTVRTVPAVQQVVKPVVQRVIQPVVQPVVNPAIPPGLVPVANPRQSCFCNRGWRGPQCGMDVDECAAHPCSNGGTCFNSAGSYRCGCQPGFTGQFQPNFLLQLKMFFVTNDQRT